jgi:NADPH2:quinone reductase
MEKNGSVTTVFFAMEQSRQPERTHQLIAGLIERIGAGELRAVTDRTFPLADAAEAHRYVETGKALGRVLLIP